MNREIMREGDKEWSASIAELIADALLDAKLIQANDLQGAIDIAAEEIFVRLSMNDRPGVDPAVTS